jgi:hypothetical protein
MTNESRNHRPTKTLIEKLFEGILILAEKEFSLKKLCKKLINLSYVYIVVEMLQ